MKISQLCDVSGVSVPSIKFYLREGLLPAGVHTSATQASYDDIHVERLRLIRALIDVGGLSIATARRVLEAVDTTDLPLTYVFGIAQFAISDASLYDTVDPGSTGLAVVDAAIQRRGWTVSDENPGRHGAARIIDTYETLGHENLATLSENYLDAAELIARADLDAVAQSHEIADMAEVVVVGTVLGDGLVSSLRRMAQQHISSELFPPTISTN